MKTTRKRGGKRNTWWAVCWKNDPPWLFKTRSTARSVACTTKGDEIIRMRVTEIKRKRAK